MKVLIDACALYPTVLREILMGVAGAGLFTPLWSPRILEEWARAAAKSGPEVEAVARGEIAVLRARWPEAEMRHDPGLEAGLSLPDENDVHVLAAAIAGQADELLTLNLRDFPTRVLAQHGVVRRDPDGFLCEFFAEEPEQVGAVVRGVHATAEHLSGETLNLRSLMKRARLPRLGKAL